MRTGSIFWSFVHIIFASNGLASTVWSLITFVYHNWHNCCEKIEITVNNVKMNSFLFFSSGWTFSRTQENISWWEEDVGKTTLSEKHQPSEGTRCLSKPWIGLHMCFAQNSDWPYISLSKRYWRVALWVCCFDFSVFHTTLSFKSFKQTQPDIKHSERNMQMCKNYCYLMRKTIIGMINGTQFKSWNPCCYFFPYLSIWQHMYSTCVLIILHKTLLWISARGVMITALKF